MTEYKKIETTYEVYSAIKKAHNDDLAVFGSYSAPTGDYGNPSVGKMFTSYGFKNGDYPIMEAETVWDIEYGERVREERHKYWLCIPLKEQE